MTTPLVPILSEPRTSTTLDELERSTREVLRGLQIPAALLGTAGDQNYATAAAALSVFEARFLHRRSR